MGAPTVTVEEAIEREVAAQNIEPEDAESDTAAETSEECVVW